MTHQEAIARIEDHIRIHGANEGLRACHIQEALNMAVDALKAQEPHVVTIADYKNNPNVDKDGNLAVWRESRHFNGIDYHEDGWVVLNRDRVEGWFNSEVIRFWTSRPTDEQRKAAEWRE